MVMNPNILQQRQKEKQVLAHVHLVERVAQRIKRRIPDHIEYQELCSGLDHQVRVVLSRLWGRNQRP